MLKAWNIFKTEWNQWIRSTAFDTLPNIYYLISCLEFTNSAYTRWRVGRNIIGDKDEACSVCSLSFTVARSKVIMNQYNLKACKLTLSKYAEYKHFFYSLRKWSTLNSILVARYFSTFIVFHKYALKSVISGNAFWIFCNTSLLSLFFINMPWSQSYQGTHSEFSVILLYFHCFS